MTEYVKTCANPACGEDFVTTRKAQKFCSDACSRIVNHDACKPTGFYSKKRTPAQRDGAYRAAAAAYRAGKLPFFMYK